MADALVSRELERCVLGAAILDPANVVVRFDNLQPTDFYDAGHQKLWRLLLAMSDAGDDIDVVSVCEHVRKDGPSYGGLSYVHGLPDEVSSTNVSFHVSRLRDLSVRRDVRHRLKDALDSVSHARLDDLIAGIDPGKDTKQGGLASAYDLGPKAWQEVLDKRHAAETGGAVCLPTPWPRVTKRWRVAFNAEKGGLVIVAGRPGMGKTSAGLQMCQHVASTMVPDRKGGHRPGAAAIFSLEMAATDCMRIAASQRSGVANSLVETSKCGREDTERYLESMEQLSGERFWVDDTPGLSASQIIRRIRRHVARHGPLDIVMVDYAELLDVGESKSKRYGQLLGAAAKDLRNAGRELGFQVILVWQLNRNCETRKPPIPQLSDLSESGEAERHADMVVFVYRDEYYFPDSTTEPGKVRVITGKIRKGETGTDTLDWVGPCTAIRELDDRYAVGVR